MTTDANDTRLVTIVLVALGALVVLPVVFMGFGMMVSGPMMSGMWERGTAPAWMPLAAVLMQLLFVAVIVGIGYLLYRAITGSDDSDRALEELRLAYARGELSDEEYEQRRDALERDR